MPGTYGLRNIYQGVAQLVESLPSKSEALSSISCIRKEGKKEGRKEMFIIIHLSSQWI
jgi:hypothetical protein